ncbi:hypothetical protein HQ393_14290 [Chitinibacter bivalviorum]|uniref:Transporter substrate-binding domain-containing protein n=1 Tax=Chitinibacter bivalviorum TaxID=2739434 RepID=A0A7H9BLJ6_9NEIS|nr:hypothetical protein [Chitinibacter bivalviorum]QLG89319.1 hypothetical protein HQ393_14290 [Chitinibacter bivalviorum]
MVRFLMAILGVLLSLGAHAEVLVAVPQDVLNDYQRLVAERKVEDIRDYRGAGSRRDTVEVILFQQALRLGGYQQRIQFVPVDSYQRNLVEVENGRVLATATTVWAADVKDSAAKKSNAMIQDGEYVVGFYVAASNRALQSADLKRLQTLSAVSNQNWKNDLAVLDSLDIRRIQTAPTFPMIAKMVAAGHGDFTLASFKSAPDMRYEIDGVRLLPVRGLKVAMPGSRHFLVAPSPEGERLRAALDKGIMQLRQEGRIRRAYTDAGFFNSKVESWRLLNQK